MKFGNISIEEFEKRNNVKFNEEDTKPIKKGKIDYVFEEDGKLYVVFKEDEEE